MIDIFIKNHPIEPKSERLLAIVDVQPHFLPERSPYSIDEYMHARKILISNILGLVEYYNDIGGKIMLVEMADWTVRGRMVMKLGETISEISSRLGKDTLLVKKEGNGLFNDLENTKDQKEAISRAAELCRRSVTEIVGVNATSCIMDSGITFKKNRMEFKINGLCTLDYFNHGADFLEDNKVSSIKRIYGKGRAYKCRSLDRLPFMNKNVSIIDNLDLGANQNATYLWDL